MAIVNSIMSFTGKLGGLSFYVNKDGLNIVRTPGGASKAKIRASPNFENTRRHNGQFGACSASAAQLRKGLMRSLGKTYDGKMDNRLLSIMWQMTKSDKASAPGEKSCFAGDTSLLEDFQWNEKKPLDAVLKADVAGFLDASAGTGHVVVSSFDPVKNMQVPDRCTHYEVFSLLTALRPGKGTEDVIYDEKSTGMLPKDSASMETITWDLSIPAEAYVYCVLGAGVRFRNEMGLVKDVSFVMLKAGRTGG